MDIEVARGFIRSGRPQGDICHLQPGDCVTTAGLVKAAHLNGKRCIVLPRLLWPCCGLRVAVVEESEYMRWLIILEGKEDAPDDIESLGTSLALSSQSSSAASAASSASSSSSSSPASSVSASSSSSAASSSSSSKRLSSRRSMFRPPIKRLSIKPANLITAVHGATSAQHAASGNGNSSGGGGGGAAAAAGRTAASAASSASIDAGTTRESLPTSGIWRRVYKRLSIATPSFIVVGVAAPDEPPPPGQRLDIPVPFSRSKPPSLPSSSPTPTSPAPSLTPRLQSHATVGATVGVTAGETVAGDAVVGTAVGTALREHANAIAAAQPDQLSWQMVLESPSIAMGAAVADPRTSSVVVLGGYSWPTALDGPVAVTAAARCSYSGVTGRARRWEAMPSMQQARCCAAAAVDSVGQIYVAGGGESMFASAQCFNTVERYACPYSGGSSVGGSSSGEEGGLDTPVPAAADSVVGVWEAMPSMNDKRCGFGMVYSPVSNMLVACGGYSGNGRYLNTIETFSLDGSGGGTETRFCF